MAAIKLRNILIRQISQQGFLRSGSGARNLPERWDSRFSAYCRVVRNLVRKRIEYLKTSCDATLSAAAIAEVEDAPLRRLQAANRASFPGILECWAQSHIRQSRRAA